MDPRLRYGVSIGLSFLTWSLVAKYYFWPVLRAQPGRLGFRPILLLHGLRFIGLGFIVPGVVSPNLSPAFATPAAYGDLIAAVLALVCLAFLERGVGVLLLWAFSIWGTADLLLAFYNGISIDLEPGRLGAMYFVTTLLVPLLFVTHVLAFRMLLTTPDQNTRP